MSSEEWDALPQPEGWGPWSHSDLLLAAIADRIGVLTYAVIATQGGTSREPQPIERPGVGIPRWEAALERSRSIARARYMAAHQGVPPPPGWDPDTDA